MLSESACPDSIVLVQRVAPFPASQAISHTSIWHEGILAGEPGIGYLKVITL